MAISEKTKAAWKNCNFCSKPNSEIAEMIRDRSHWNNLPLGYQCAWARISQVGFGTFGRLPLWRDLCRARANENNAPSYDWSQPSDWTESWCETYIKLHALR